MTSQIEWLVGLSLLGFLLLTLEVFLPGMVLGVVGGLCLLGGVGVAFSAFGTAGGFLAILVLLVLMAIYVPTVIKYAPRSPFGKMLTLNASGAGQKSSSPEFPKLVGQSGVTTSPLRLSGIANINGHRVDVISESGPLEKGTPIRVVRVEGLRIIVEPVEQRAS